jgi:hypothetical protein
VVSFGGVDRRTSVHPPDSGYPLEFGRAWLLRFHLLDPPRPPLGRLERLRVVAGVPSHLAVVQLHDGHDVEDLPPAVVLDALRDPQTILEDNPPRIAGGSG